MGYKTSISVYIEVVLLRVFSARPVALFFDYPESCRLPNSWNGFAPCTTQGFFLVLDKVRYRFKGHSVLGLTHLLRPDAVSWLERGRPWDPYFGFAVFDSATAEYTPPVSARCRSPCFGIGRSGATTTQRYRKLSSGNLLWIFR